MTSTVETPASLGGKWPLAGATSKVTSHLDSNAQALGTQVHDHLLQGAIGPVDEQLAQL
jgi:hypothetical protein